MHLISTRISWSLFQSTISRRSHAGRSKMSNEADGVTLLLFAFASDIFRSSYVSRAHWNTETPEWLDGYAHNAQLAFTSSRFLNFRPKIDSFQPTNFSHFTIRRILRQFSVVARLRWHLPRYPSWRYRKPVSFPDCKTRVLLSEPPTCVNTIRSDATLQGINWLGQNCLFMW